MKKLLLSTACMLVLIGFLKAQPANDNSCGAISIPVENLGCEPTVTYSYTGATWSSGSGNTWCENFQNLDVWFKFVVPANGTPIVSIDATDGNAYTAEMYTSNTCNSLAVFNSFSAGYPCLNTNISSEKSRKFTGLTPGAEVYMRVYRRFSNTVAFANGAVKICVSNNNVMADEPCSAGFFPLDAEDPLGQDCVPVDFYSWTGATLTPSIPNPSCISPMPPANVRDVWFKLRVPASGKLRINHTYNGTCITAYTATACNGTFTELACGFFGFNWTNLTANSIVYIRIFRYTGTGAPLTDGSAKICAAISNQVPAANNTAGRVGIGIDTPFAKLDVVGNGIFRSTLTTLGNLETRGDLIVAGNILSKYGNTKLPNNTSVGGLLSIDSLALGNRLGNRISIYGGLGSVPQYGFGIQSGLLQIYSDGVSSNIALGYGNSNNFIERMRITNSGPDGMSLNGRLSLKNGTADINQGAGVWLYKADNTGQLGFMGTQNNQNVGFYGGSGGWGFVYNAINSRVGIGTNNPTSLLNVNGQITIDQKNFGGYGGLLIKGNTPGSNYPNIGFSINNSVSADVVSALISGDLVNNTAGAETIDLTFQTSQTGQGGIAERMRIKGNGFVGIGNNNPTQPLSFPAALGEKILLYPGGVGEVGIGVYGGELRLHCDIPGGKVSFGTQTNAGVFSENALAQRNGVFAFSVLGSLWVNGATYASDQRFKQNITTIASPLQKLMQINGVEYEMKTTEFDKYHFQPGRQMGLLAQNVETVVPEAVNEKEGYKGVDYARLVPLLIEAIKEQQQQRNADLKRIVLLEKQLKDLQIK